MAAKIDIMNKAINLLGEAYINSPTQATKAASRINTEYDSVRDLVLRSHTWNFAIKRVKLNKSAETPTYNWEYAFPLPSDFIRLVRVSDTDTDYDDVEAPPWEIGLHGASNVRAILSDFDQCYITYVSRVTDENLFDPLFVSAFAAALAKETAYSIVQDIQLKKDLDEYYYRVLRRAKSIDSQESNNQSVIDTAWLNARINGRG